MSPHGKNRGVPEPETLLAMNELQLKLTTLVLEQTAKTGTVAGAIDQIDVAYLRGAGWCGCIACWAALAAASNIASAVVILNDYDDARVTWAGMLERREQGLGGGTPNLVGIDGGRANENPPSVGTSPNVGAPCVDCGHGPNLHHKLHCEADDCEGCPGGWRCPQHGWVNCGCTYAGGVSPSTGTYELKA